MKAIRKPPRFPWRALVLLHLPGRMAQLQFTASAVFSLLGSSIGALVRFLGPSWDRRNRRYRPEDHYMRGPGPKWREKNFAVDRHPPAIARGIFSMQELKK